MSAIKIAQHSPELNLVCVDADGMHRGMLADFNAAKTALNRLIDSAELQLGMDVRRVAVGVAGSHLESKQARTSFPLQNKAVTQSILMQMFQSVETQNKKRGREILHCVPIQYQIDAREPLQNPLGFSGSLIKGEYLVIYSDKNYLKDVIRLCNQSGLQVSNVFAEPLASATVAVSDEAKQKGCVIADIGGGTTDGIVFQDGRPVHLFTVNIGGFVMTKDLSIGLNVSDEQAEHAKVFFGLRPSDSGQQLPVGDQEDQRALQWRDVFPVLSPRIRELGNLIVNEIIDYKGALPAGLLLTGGGANIRGLSDFLSDQLRVPAKQAFPSLDVQAVLEKRPDNQTTSYKKPHPSKFATVLGLLNLEMQCRSKHSGKSNGMGSRYISQFVNWLKELS